MIEIITIITIFFFINIASYVTGSLSGENALIL